MREQLIHEMKDMIMQGKLSESDTLCKKLIEDGMPEAEATAIWIETYQQFKGKK